jgi:hypothetical protein
MRKRRGEDGRGKMSMDNVRTDFRNQVSETSRGLQVPDHIRAARKIDLVNSNLTSVFDFRRVVGGAACQFHLPATIDEYPCQVPQKDMKTD